MPLTIVQARVVSPADHDLDTTAAQR